MKSEITYDEAHWLFRYDADTGKLFWRVSRGHRAASGDEAGAVYRAGRTQYRLLGVSGKKYLVHRIIWLMLHGEWPEGEIDHIDGDGLNNRLGNLRDVPSAINQRNSRMHRNNTSGVNGVSWSKTSKKWKAQSHNGTGRQKYLGLYIDLADAERAVREFQASRGFAERHGLE